MQGAGSDMLLSVSTMHLQIKSLSSQLLVEQQKTQTRIELQVQCPPIARLASREHYAPMPSSVICCALDPTHHGKCHPCWRQNRSKGSPGPSAQTAEASPCLSNEASQQCTHHTLCAQTQALHAATERALRLANMELEQVQSAASNPCHPPPHTHTDPSLPMQQRVAHAAAEARSAQYVLRSPVIIRSLTASCHPRSRHATRPCVMPPALASSSQSMRVVVQAHTGAGRGEPAPAGTAPARPCPRPAGAARADGG